MEIDQVLGAGLAHQCEEARRELLPLLERGGEDLPAISEAYNTLLRVRDVLDGVLGGPPERYRVLAEADAEVVPHPTKPRSWGLGPHEPGRYPG